VPQAAGAADPAVRVMLVAETELAASIVWQTISLSDKSQFAPVQAQSAPVPLAWAFRDSLAQTSS